MKKLLSIACLASMAIAITGCGGKPKVPENTVAAAYINVEKAYENIVDVASAFIDIMPAKAKESAKQEFEMVQGQAKEFLDELNPKWAVVSFGGEFDRLGGSPEECAAAVLKVDAKEEKLVAKIKELAAGMGAEGKDGVYRLNGAFVGNIGGDYVVVGASKESFSEMFDLYSGKGKASGEFDGLSDLSGDTVARLATVPISSLIERFELARHIEKFGEECGDKELADMITGLGPISYDLTFGMDEIGASLNFGFRNAKDAETFGHLLHSIAFLSRVGFDASSYALGSKMLDSVRGNSFISDAMGPISKFSNAAGEVCKLYAKAVKAKCEGATASLSCVFDTDEALKLVSKIGEEK